MSYIAVMDLLDTTNLADEEIMDMVSLVTSETGIHNTIFVSTKGYAQHAPRIKIAIDPPNSFSATSKTASMAIHDYSTLGEPIPTHIAKQARQFIERNRDVLLEYWNNKIGTGELIRRIRPV